MPPPLCCFHSQSPHPPRSQYSPKYRPEQDILHFANTHFIRIGSACWELAFCLRKDGKASSFATSFGSRTPIHFAKILANFRLSQTTGDPSRHSNTATQVSNRTPSSQMTLMRWLQLLIGIPLHSLWLLMGKFMCQSPQNAEIFLRECKSHYSSTDSLDSADRAPFKVAVRVLHLIVSPSRVEARVQESSVVVPVISSTPVVASPTADGSTAINHHGLQCFCEEINIDKFSDCLLDIWYSSARVLKLAGTAYPCSRSFPRPYWAWWILGISCMGSNCCTGYFS